MKRIVSILMVLAIMCSCFVACAKPDTETNFGDQLASLKDVTSVSVIEQDSPVFAEKYLMTFTQPIDWENPELGTFEQRVEVGFNSADKNTVFQVGGYSLFDQYMPMDDRSEIAKMMDGCNIVNVEYRFFGKSIPEGLDHDSVEMWEYLTVQNACDDFHAIMEAMKTLLPEKWYFTGASKGGQATNVYAYYYPEDCFAYAAYVAPFADGSAMPGMTDPLFTTIGDTWLGAEKAAETRTNLTNIVVDLVENRETLQQQYWDYAMESGNTYRSFVTPEILYDMALLETVIQYWQLLTPVETIENIIALKDTDPESYMQECYNFMLSMAGPENWSTNFLAFPYYVQAKKENGCYLYDFKYIREALEAANATQKLAITEEMEEDILWNVVFTEEQKAAFTYDSTLREAMLNWLDTTESNVVMIYGAVDPWTSMRLPDTDNTHVASYTLPDRAHNARISAMTDETMKNDVLSRLQLDAQ